MTRFYAWSRTGQRRLHGRLNFRDDKSGIDAMLCGAAAPARRAELSRLRRINVLCEVEAREGLMRRADAGVFQPQGKQEAMESMREGLNVRDARRKQYDGWRLRRKLNFCD